MEPENKVLVFLKRFRYLILAAMVIASLVGAIARSKGDGSLFWTVLGAQAWFTQAVFAYLRGGSVFIGPGGLSKDDSPIGRALLAVAALGFYLLMFSYDAPQHDSIHEKRPSDWTMPAREEIGRSPEA